MFTPVTHMTEQMLPWNHAFDACPVRPSHEQDCIVWVHLQAWFCTLTGLEGTQLDIQVLQGGFRAMED